MLIKELIEALVKPSIERPPKDPNLDFDDSSWDIDTVKRKNLNPPGGVGSGMYSYGEPGQDPHEYNVKNWFPTDLAVDGKYHWIKAILPIMSDNPYLPKYYNIKYLRDRYGQVKMNYNIERLSELNTLSTEQLQSIAVKAFNDESLYDVKVTPDMISDRIEDIYDGKLPIDNIDINLKNTIELIKPIIDQDSVFHLDIHPGNIMARMTNIGPQLVIADPIGDGGASIKNNDYR